MFNRARQSARRRYTLLPFYPLSCVADGFVTAGAVIAALGFATNLLIVALTPTACAEAILRGHSMKLSFIGDIVGGCKSSERRT
jgi:hypothetical protein